MVPDDKNYFENLIPNYIPQYIENNKHLLVSLLYLDFDIYEPTVTALNNFLPRMSKGSVIAFDEINNKDYSFYYLQ